METSPTPSTAPPALIECDAFGADGVLREAVLGFAVAGRRLGPGLAAAATLGVALTAAATLGVALTATTSLGIAPAGTPTLGVAPAAPETLLVFLRHFG